MKLSQFLIVKPSLQIKIHKHNFIQILLYIQIHIIMKKHKMYDYTIKLSTCL